MSSHNVASAQQRRSTRSGSSRTAPRARGRRNARTLSGAGFDPVDQLPRLQLPIEARSHPGRNRLFGRESANRRLRGVLQPGAREMGAKGRGQGPQYSRLPWSWRSPGTSGASRPRRRIGFLPQMRKPLNAVRPGSGVEGRGSERPAGHCLPDRSRIGCHGRKKQRHSRSQPAAGATDGRVWGANSIHGGGSGECRSGSREGPVAGGSSRADSSRCDKAIQSAVSASRGDHCPPGIEGVEPERRRPSFETITRIGRRRSSKTWRASGSTFWRKEKKRARRWMVWRPPPSNACSINMESTRSEVVDRFVARLRDQVEPLLTEAKDSLQKLEASGTALRKESRQFRRAWRINWD